MYRIGVTGYTGSRSAKTLDGHDRHARNRLLRLGRQPTSLRNLTGREVTVAHYLIVESNEVPIGTIVEAKNIQRAIEQTELKDGESVVVYRIANGPRKVNVTSEKIRRIEIE